MKKQVHSSNSQRLFLKQRLTRKLCSVCLFLKETVYWSHCIHTDCKVLCRLQGWLIQGRQVGAVPDCAGWQLPTGDTRCQVLSFSGKHYGKHLPPGAVRLTERAVAMLFQNGKSVGLCSPHSYAGGLFPSFTQ